MNRGKSSKSSNLEYVDGAISVYPREPLASGQPLRVDATGPHLAGDCAEVSRINFK